MNAIEQLKSVLCDPEGTCCIAGSDEDRAIIDRALQALAAQQEPVGRFWQHPLTKQWHQVVDNYNECVALYTTLRQRTWVGLTEEERVAVLLDKDGKVLDYEDYAEAIEAKLRSKNYE